MKVKYENGSTFIEVNKSMDVLYKGKHCSCSELRKVKMHGKNRGQNSTLLSEIRWFGNVESGLKMRVKNRL